MSAITKRDWALEKIRTLDTVTSAMPVGNDFILIHRRDDYLDKSFPPFTTGVVSSKTVTPGTLNPLLELNQEFQFVMNIPKDAPWEGAAIQLVEDNNLGWGGFGELMSALGEETVRGFQKKEYSFALKGLQQHTRVIHITRIYDRLIEIRRTNPLTPIRAVLLYEYELTAERIRHARSVYGEFSLVARTNPNGAATGNAHDVAAHLGAEILQWGDFLSRLNRP